MSTATITPAQQILRWLAVICALGALAFMVAVFQHLMIAAGAATETGLSTLQLLYIFGAGFVLIVGAILSCVGAGCNFSSHQFTMGAVPLAQTYLSTSWRNEMNPQIYPAIICDAPPPPPPPGTLSDG